MLKQHMAGGWRSSASSVLPQDASFINPLSSRCLFFFLLAVLLLCASCCLEPADTRPLLSILPPDPPSRPVLPARLPPFKLHPPQAPSDCASTPPSPRRSTLRRHCRARRALLALCGEALELLLDAAQPRTTRSAAARVPCCRGRSSTREEEQQESKETHRVESLGIALQAGRGALLSKAQRGERRSWCLEVQQFAVMFLEETSQMRSRSD